MKTATKFLLFGIFWLALWVPLTLLVTERTHLAEDPWIGFPLLLMPAGVLVVVIITRAMRALARGRLTGLRFARIVCIGTGALMQGIAIEVLVSGPDSWRDRILWALGLALAGGLLVMLAFRLLAMQRAAWIRDCETRRWRYAPDGEPVLRPEALGQPPLSTMWSRPEFVDVVTGVWQGMPFQAFEAGATRTLWRMRRMGRHRLGGPRETELQNIRVLHVTTSITSPGLTLRREGLGLKFKQAFGADDIDLHEDPDFSAHVWANSPQPAWARDVLRGAAAELRDFPSDLHVAWHGRDLFVFAPGELMWRDIERMAAVARPLYASQARMHSPSTVARARVAVAPAARTVGP